MTLTLFLFKDVPRTVYYGLPMLLVSGNYTRNWGSALFRAYNLMMNKITRSLMGILNKIKRCKI